MLLALALLVMVNDYRAEYDLPPLLSSAHLTEAAQWMAEDTAKGGYSLNHTDSLERGPFERIGAFGFTNDRRAENLAFGSADPKAVLHVWRDSPGHNANLLDPQFMTAGVGTHDGYWVLNLGGCRDCPKTYPQWRWP